MGRDLGRLDAMRRRDPLPRSGPQHVVMDLTNRCNNNCIACWTRSPLLRDQGPPPAWFDLELSESVARGAINDLSEMGCEILRFTGGGEPTLHPAFDVLVRASVKAGLKTAVTTNGTRFSDFSIDLWHELDEVTVSLWSATKATYARLHPNKTGQTFERIVGAMGQLKERSCGGPNPDLVIANVIGMMNFHEIGQMLELAVELGADRVYFAVVDPIPGCTDGLLLDERAAHELLACVPELFDRYRGRVTIDNEHGFLRRLAHNDPHGGRYDRNVVDAVPCLVGWGFARIMANGDVVPCCRAVQRPMGNLNTASLPQIWRSASYQEFRGHSDSPKQGVFFRGIGCHTSCDNLMHNEEWFRLL